MGGNQDEMFLCPIRALKKYLSGTELCCPAWLNLFVLVSKMKKWVFQNTNLFWIRLVISHVVVFLLKLIVMQLRLNPMRYKTLVLLISLGGIKSSVGSSVCHATH